MLINFDTSSASPVEIKGLIAFLSNLLPLSDTPLVKTTYQPPAPKNEAEAIFGVPVKAEPESEPGPAQPAASAPPPAQPAAKRTRQKPSQFARKAVEKLIALGKDAIPMVIEALGTADKSATTTGDAPKMSDVFEAVVRAMPPMKQS